MNIHGLPPASVISNAGSLARSQSPASREETKTGNRDTVEFKLPSGIDASANSGDRDGDGREGQSDTNQDEEEVAHGNDVAAVEMMDAPDSARLEEKSAEEKLSGKRQGTRRSRIDLRV